MNLAIQKTLSFVLLIVVGVLLKKKISKKEQLGGIKSLILSIALPATIFIALLKININPSLLSLPLLALGFNMIMFFSANYVLSFVGIKKGSPQLRTLSMLLPSLAPGLSCFPFIIEYLGEESLAWAALADVGNKIFVLIILYLVAMHWYQQIFASKEESNSSSRLRMLMISLVKEPVNLVIVTAIMMLSFGLNMSFFPEFLQDAIGRMSIMMTPLILLFIGLAVRVKWSEVKIILSLLLWRSGFAFCISALVLLIHPMASIPAALVMVIFPQSACSFWPFAHMSAIDHLESRKSEEKRAGKTTTFDSTLALNVLAFSLPFSTIIILTICSVGAFFTHPLHLFGIGVGFISAFLIPSIIQRFSSSASKAGEEVLDGEAKTATQTG